MPQANVSQYFVVFIQHTQFATCKPCNANGLMNFGKAVISLVLESVTDGYKPTLTSKRTEPKEQGRGLVYGVVWHYVEGLASCQRLL